MAEMRKPKKNKSEKGSGAGKGRAGNLKPGGDKAAKAQHGTQGGPAASSRKDSPRVPSGRAGGKGGGPKKG